MATITTVFREFHLDVKKYLITAALIGFSYFGFVAVLLNLYLLRIGYTTSFIGFVNGSSAMAFAVTSIPSGIIGSRWGMRRTAVTGLVLLATGLAFLPLTQQLPRSVWDIAIIITRCMTGMGFAFYSVNSFPYLTAATNNHNRTHAFAIQASMTPLLGFLGASIAGVMPAILAKLMTVTTADSGPFAVLLFISGLIILPGVFLIGTTTERQTHIRNRIKVEKTRQNNYNTYLIICFLAVSGFMRVFGEAAVRSFFNVYMEIGLGKTPVLIGFAMAIGQLVGFPAALSAPALANRFGKTKAIVFSTLLTGISILIIALFPHWIFATIGFSLTLGFRAITLTISRVVQMEIVKPEWRGVTSGIVSMALGFGFSSMSFGGGYLVRFVEFKGLFFVAAIISIAGSLIFGAFFTKPRGEYLVSGKDNLQERPE